MMLAPFQLANLLLPDSKDVKSTWIQNRSVLIVPVNITAQTELSDGWRSHEILRTIFR